MHRIVINDDESGEIICIYSKKDLSKKSGRIGFK
jgi:hypothetical protein